MNPPLLDFIKESVVCYKYNFKSIRSVTCKFPYCGQRIHFASTEHFHFSENQLPSVSFSLVLCFFMPCFR